MSNLNKVLFTAVAIALCFFTRTKHVHASSESHWYIRQGGGPGADHMSWYVIANDKGQDVVCMTVGQEPGDITLHNTNSVSCAPFNNPK